MSTSDQKTVITRHQFVSIGHGKFCYTLGWIMNGYSNLVKLQIKETMNEYEQKKIKVEKKMLAMFPFVFPTG